MKNSILLKNITEKTEKYLSDIFFLKKEKAEVESENKTLAEELHKANNQLQRNNIEISSLKVTIVSNENSINDLKKENLELKSQITKQSEKIKENENEIVKCSNKLEEINKRNIALEAQNDDLLNESESSKKLIKEYEIELQRLKDFFEQKKKMVNKKKTKE